MNGAGEKQPGERRLRSQIHAELSMVGVGSSEDMGLFRRITWNSVVGVQFTWARSPIQIDRFTRIVPALCYPCWRS